MPLHVACVYCLASWVVYHRHLEQKHVVGGHWCTAHIIAHAVEVIAIAEEFTAESTEDQNILAIFLNCSTSLSFWEHLVIDFYLSPFAFV